MHLWPTYGICELPVDEGLSRGKINVREDFFLRLLEVPSTLLNICSFVCYSRTDNFSKNSDEKKKTCTCSSMLTIGELNPKETGVFEWVIHDYFTLSSEEGATYVSPFFNFINVNWYLEMYPNGSKNRNSEGYISLFLHRKYPAPRIKMEYTLGLKTVDQELCPEWHLIHDFKDIHGCGFHNFMHRNKILGRRYDVLTTDTLIFVCKLKPPKCVARASTEISMLHASKVLQDYKKLFCNQNYCDVIIQVREQKFSAHRNILSARSPVFESIFRNEMKEKRTGIVVIDDCDPSTFSNFLCFIYCGDIQIITVENVFSLFTAADKYDVNDLRARCLEFMIVNVSIDNFCDTMTLALLHSETELIKLAYDFFSKNALEILKTVKWQSFFALNPIEGNEIIIRTLESYKNRVK